MGCIYGYLSTFIFIYHRVNLGPRQRLLCFSIKKRKTCGQINTSRCKPRFNVLDLLWFEFPFNRIYIIHRSWFQVGYEDIVQHRLLTPLFQVAVRSCKGPWRSWPCLWSGADRSNSWQPGSGISWWAQAAQGSMSCLLSMTCICCICSILCNCV